jgi:hypothetical protein
VTLSRAEVVRLDALAEFERGGHILASAIPRNRRRGVKK